MATNRYVNTHFWDDEYIEKLNISEKLLFLYLITNPLANICGIYEITKKRMKDNTGLKTSIIEKTLNKFQADKKAFYVNNYIIMKNTLKNQKLNDNMRLGAEKIYTELPDFVKLFINNNKENALEGFESLSNALNNININNNINSNVNINENENKEEKKSLSQKIKFLDEVFLTQKEYDGLIEDYGERMVNGKIEDADEWLAQGNRRKNYTDHNKMIRKWLRKDGVNKIEKYKEPKPEKEQPIPEPEWVKELKSFQEACPKYFKEIDEYINVYSLNSWFKPLKFISETDKLISLYTPKQYIVSWINEHYSPLLEGVFKKDFVIKSVNDNQ